MGSQYRWFRRRTLSGFTLVELLVVIGVIAVLIAILLPALAKARRSAVTLKCLSNMRQLGTGIQMYMSSNRDAMPAAGYGQYYADGVTVRPNWNGSFSFPTWRQLIYPYITAAKIDLVGTNGVATTGLPDLGVVACPANAQGSRSLFTSGMGMGWRMSYYGNALNTGGNTVPPMNRTDKSGAWMKPAKMSSPSTVIVLYEGGSDGGPTGSSGISPAGDPTRYWFMHKNLANYAFADGHAETLDPLATVSPRNLWTVGNQAPASSSFTTTLKAMRTIYAGY